MYSPLFIPISGDLQKVLIRLCPILDPALSFRNGRTRAKLRQGVSLKKRALMGGKWLVGVGKPGYCGSYYQRIY